MIDSIKLNGSLKVLLQDSEGNTKQEYDFKNLVVDVGKAFIVNAIVASSTSPFTRIAIGSNNTAQTTSDTALYAELARTTFSYTSTNTSITFTATFAPGVGTGTVREAGIFNNSTGGTMLSRTTFLDVSKTATDQLTVVWTINLN